MNRVLASIAVLVATFLPAQAEGPKLSGPDQNLAPAPLLLPDSKTALDALKDERKAIAKERSATNREPEDDSSSAAERRALRKRIEDLIEKMGKKSSAPPKGPEPRIPSDPPKERRDPPAGRGEIKANDPVARAVTLYRAEQYDAAYQAFKIIDLGGLGREDRAFVQYMTGCCLRRVDKLSEAAAVFRDVQGTAEAISFTDLAQVDDCVGVCQQIAFFDWPRRQFFEHHLVRCVE